MNTNASQNTRRTLTEDRMANHKLALFVASAVSFAINLMLIVMLAIDGISFLYVMFPMLMCILSVAFIVISAFTNFRCSYSLWYTILYSLLFAITAVMFGLVLMGFGKESAMTYFAIGLWALVNLLNLIAIISGSVRAGSFKKGARATVAIIILLVSIAGYTYFITSLGFFGQGAETSDRPVTFVYDEEEKFYVATGTLTGKGKVVTVPETFNGVKVGAIDCSIFSTENVHTVVLNCASNVEFRSPELLASIPEGLSVQASRDTLNGMTSTVYEMATTGNAEAALAFAQTFAPSDLSDNEVYVTFTYTEESVKAAEGKFMPIWIGEAGTALSFDDTFPSYVNGFADRFDESNLAAIFNTDAYNGGYVVSDIKDAKGNSVFGSKISENLDNVLVTFEKVYRVEVKADNDDLYELEDDFRFLDDANEYRFVTPSTAGDLLAEADPRDGFTLAWTYALGQSNEQTALTDLAAVVATEAEENLSIKPTWTMLPPSITSCTTDGVANTFTYGDEIIFSSAANAPAAGLDVRYEWFKDGASIHTTSTFDVTNVKMTEAGEYTVVVTSYSDTLTSLFSTSEQKLTLTVNKKELPITWLGLDDTDSYGRVYNAQNSRVNITYDSDALVYGEDAITWQINDLDEHYIRNAGSHTATAKLTGDADTKYYIKDSAKSNTYTISPAEITLSFSNYNNQTYQGITLYPTVSHSKLLGSDTTDGLGLTVTGKTHVSDPNTVYAGITDTNYKIVVNTDVSNDGNVYTVDNSGAAVFSGFVINPASLKLDFSNNVKVYTAFDQIPTVTPIGLFGSDDPGLTIGAKKNVSDTESITVSISNGDYKLAINGEETYTLNSFGDALYPDFSITPANLKLAFSNISLVYNAEEQYPTVTPIGLLGADNYESLHFTIGGKTNVSNHNSIKVSIANTNYTLIANDADSYTIDTLGAAEYNGFEITKAPITVVWNKANSFEYNGNYIWPAVDDRTGVFEKDQAAVTVFTDETASRQKLASDAKYVATAAMSDSTGNYELVNNITREFSIYRKTLTVTWTNCETVYNGLVQAPSANLVQSEICGSDSVTVVFSVYDGTNTVVEAQNAATYTAKATLSGFDSENYVINTDYVVKSYKISPAPLTLTFEHVTPTYTGTSQKPTVIFNGLQNGEPVSILSSTIGEKTNVTDTNVIAISIVNSNYILTSDSEHSNYTVINSSHVNFGGFAIQPKEITLIFSDTSKVYSGKGQSPTVDAYGLVNDQTKSVLNLSIGTKRDVAHAGSIVVEISNPNYKIVENAAYTLSTASKVFFENFTITKAPLVLSFEDTSPTYNAELQCPTVKVAGLVNNQSESVLGMSVSGKTNVNDNGLVNVKITNGNYKLTIDSTHKDYNVVSESSATFAGFSISKASITVSWERNNHFIYKNDVIYPSVTSWSGVFAADASEVNVATNASKSQQTEASSSHYTAYATLTDSTGNYELGEGATATFYIDPKPLNVLWPNLSFVYNGIDQTSSANPDVEDGATADDDGKYYRGQSVYVDWENISDSGAAIDSGTYILKATLGGPNAGNYTIGTGEICTNFQITKRPVTIVWNNDAKTYDGSADDKAPTLHSITGMVKGDDLDIDVKLSYGHDGKSAGNHSYKATLIGDDKNNYSISAGGTCTVTILPKTVTLSVTGKTYNGYNQQPEIKLNGIVNDDTCTITVTGYQKNVGDNTEISISISNKNYKLGNGGGYSVVGDRNATISNSFISPATITDIKFESLTYNGTARNAVVESVYGLMESDSLSTLNLNVTGNQTNVGMAENIHVIINNDNYVFEGGEKDLVFEDRAFITVAGIELFFETKPYNGETQQPTVTFSGTYNSDNPGITINGTQTNVGDTNTITVSVTNSNYCITRKSYSEYTLNTDGTASYNKCFITPKSVDVSWTAPTSLVYDGSTKVYSATAEGAPITLTYYTKRGSSWISLTTTAPINAGSYKVVVTTNNNYSLNGITYKEFTITPKSVYISWTAPTSLVYNGSTKVYSAEAGGAPIKLSYYTSSGGMLTSAPKNAGSYKVVATTTSGNYTLNNDTVLFTIKKATLSVTWFNDTQTYTGSLLKPTAKLNGDVVPGDDVSLSVTGAIETGVHDVTATLTGADASNYQLSAGGANYVTGKLIITQKPANENE